MQDAGEGGRPKGLFFAAFDAVCYRKDSHCVASKNRYALQLLPTVGALTRGLVTV